MNQRNMREENMSSVSVRASSITGDDGWISVDLHFKNTSSKGIKYVTFRYYAINSVGDPIEGACAFKFTGPYNPGKTDSGRWRDVWPNYRFHHLKLDFAYIEYMDGTDEKIQGASVGSYNGCYIATAVYGTYDCPQVWTLRRFRDNFLSKTAYGRIFIRIYYKVSPCLVKLFGNSKWFCSVGRNILDSIVTRLNKRGFENTRYKDL